MAQMVKVGRGRKHHLLLSLLFISLIVCSFFASSSTASKGASGKAEDPEDEDLSFLEEGEDDGHGAGHDQVDGFSEEEFEGGFEGLDDGSEDHEPAEPPVDEKDVVVLNEGNFSRFIEENRYVMVEFYAPWCGHCQALAPEFAAAATELKGVAALAKVDATVENDLAQKYDVQGYPTVFFFVDGIHKQYPGARSKDAIVSWIKKKTGPAVQNITTVEDAENVLTVESVLVLAFLNSLVGPENAELSAASRLEDGVSFYQTVNEDVAKLFHIDPKAKRPSLVLLKKEAEKINHFDGEFSKSAIVDFVFSNKLPLVTTFTRESASSIFDNPIKKQVLIFVRSNDYEATIPIFQEAAKLFKGKLLFVHVDMDNEDVGKPVSEYFGVSGDGPIVLGYSGNDDSKKYKLDGEVNLDALKAFAEGFLQDKLKLFYKSDPVPEKNDGDVKIVVSNNFDEVVLDESKDVLLEIYAPWCGHCQALEPTYNKLGKHLRGIDSLVIAKMDGTTNEHPRAKSDGFPTLLFFPAGNKSFDPIVVETDRTVVAFYKFLKKHASIPFKLQKPVKKVESDVTETAAPTEGDGGKDVKDEL
ncbi:disulfide isomerase-like 1-4 protein [Nymphaea thermarum]|nr:disulfide isomerase-like 1-4 protein [Nymphaea thermarum]